MAVKEATGSMAVHKNMPPVSGAQQWGKELVRRVQDHMADYRRIDHPSVLFVCLSLCFCVSL